MKTRKILNYLYKMFPLSIGRKNHDFCGVMVNPLPFETNKILLCLDLDEDVFPYIDSFHPDLVITHHPFIYGPKRKEVLKNDPQRKKWYDALKLRNVAVCSFHTNFDEGKGGMNDVLASMLELEDVYSPIDAEVMRIGYLKEEMHRDEFVEYAVKRLKVPYGLFMGYGKEFVKKIGIIGGGGASFFKHAIDNDVDIYISGDAPHYIRRDVVNAHFNYLDVPHEVERVFMKRMEELLLKLDNSLEILIVDQEKEPICIIDSLDD